jgi:pimeloyl-ACP methyl ester carboxylesterase
MKLVVWFPGLGSFANVTGNILEFFENDPDTDVITLSYDAYGLGGYRSAAKRLVGPLQSLLDSYDLVYFVGHSMGGHVAATLVTDYGLKPNKIVAVSSPLSAFTLLEGINSFVHQKHTLKGLIEDFSAHPHWPHDIPVLQVYGVLDILANPASPLLSTRPTLEQANVVSERISNHSHLSILWSTRAAAEIYAFCTYRD